MRIMIVDDDPDICSILVSILHTHYPRVAVDYMHNGAEVLGAIEADEADGRPDIVITDVNMPIMDGVELCHALRKLPGPRIAVAALSASDFDREQFDAAFSKPFDFGRLFEFVDAAMRSAGCQQYSLSSKYDRAMAFMPSGFL